MEQYFFDVHDGRRLVRDQIGAPMESPDAAWIAAGRILLDFIEDGPFPGHAERSHMYVRVRNCRGVGGLVELSLSPVDTVPDPRDLLAALP